MATDYFAHAVYGILLEDEDHAKVNEAVQTGQAALSKTDPEWADRFLSEQFDLVLTWLDENRPELEKELRNKYLAPPWVHLLWTGSEGDRPGRCSTPPDCWILGIALHDDSFFRLAIYEKFQAAAEWHTWVTFG